jgi:hypothetical protein
MTIRLNFEDFPPGGICPLSGFGGALCVEFGSAFVYSSSSASKRGPRCGGVVGWL